MFKGNHQALEGDTAAASITAQQLQLTLEAVPTGMLVTDGTNRIVLVNAQIEALFGYPRGELLGRHMEMLVPERFRKSLPALRESFSGDPKTRARGADRELQGLRKDGSEVPIEIGLNPLKTAEGNFVLSSISDITERRQAAQQIHALNVKLEERVIERTAALASANTRFAIASEAAGLGFWEFDVGSNTLRWDEQMFILYGRPIATGQQPYSIWSGGLHPDDRQRIEGQLIAAIKGPCEFQTEFRVIHPSGEIRHLKASARALRDGQGNAVQMMGVNIDITDRKRAEVDLRESGQRYRFLADAMPQIIWTAKPDGEMDYYNQPWYDYSGLTFEQTRERGWTPVLHADDLQVCVDRWFKAHTTASHYEIECRFKRAADGAYRWHLVRAMPLRDRQGAIVQWVGTCTDIDEQKRAEVRLREAQVTLEQRVGERTRELSAAKAEADRANAAKSEFLANMSHEIRTPLNAVIGLGFLLEQTTLTEDQHQFLSKIQFAGRSLLSVVNNVLDLSKIEAREMTLEEESFDLPELFTNISQMLTAQAKFKGIKLIVEPRSDLPRFVIGDVARLRQILINLLNNAIKFTDVGHVELKAYYTEHGSDHVRLRCEVIDTGIGIEPAVVKRMFVPFAQADASTTRRFGGTGLGLSIARHLVELMGGEIEANSTVGVGSTFWFEIPLGIAHSFDAKISAEGLRISVIDSGSAGSVTGMLRALGWAPHAVPTGRELLDFLKADQSSRWPHVLIAPAQLDDMDVHELIAGLEAACTDREVPPVIVIADCAQSYLEHQPRLRSTNILLALPLTSSALFNAVNAAVTKRAAGRERIMQVPETHTLNTKWLVGVRVLVVDDSPLNREVAQAILQNQGAIVTTCSDGRKAVEHVRAHHRELDVVLMDVQMPILDGNEATQLIRGELKLQNLPIIALTAGALASERQRALKAGMNDIVTKPFDPQLLIRKVRYLVEQTRDAPIPIATLDRKRNPRHAAGPLISSLDGGVVRQMFGEDLSLFKSALSRLLKDFAEFAGPICAAVDDESARSKLKARVHELRGSAGLIGANRVMRIAGEVETALEEGRCIDMGSMLGQLTSAFSEMRDEALYWLAKQAERENLSGDKAAARHIASADIAELQALLDSRNLAALDKFSSLSPALGELLGPALHEQLRDALDNLDFVQGAQLLRKPGCPVPSH